ncbi:MAG: DUF1549 domain-containing protein, partial [Pirellulales bacterium]|nr:DUF1549 domain-containing protein [Pirellulales bacterium]
MRQTPLSGPSAQGCRILRPLYGAALSLLFASRALAADADPVTAQAPPAITFEEHIRPIFKAHCFHCHGAEGEPKSGLDVRLRRSLEAGGEAGAALVPGKRDESPIFVRTLAGEMPPGDHKLTAQQIELIGQWIDAGAPTKRPEPENINASPGITPEDRQFWAFQPVTRPEVPKHGELANPVDRFLVDKLVPAGLAFSPPAERLALLLRATFDLTGLPPSLDEVRLFLADTAPDAYERLIDRLLASPHYGERWGRHWLDVAGYAESDGYVDEDRPRPYAYKYRDYVIRAFNSDKPLDAFIVEQLAGDELLTPPYTNLNPDQIEKLVATGFLRMAADGTGTAAIDEDLARNATMADTIKIVSTSLLGLSVGCAQCHDHRYDPILHTDYYRLRDVFEPAYN